jgi:hypothetical protein
MSILGPKGQSDRLPSHHVVGRLVAGPLSVSRPTANACMSFTFAWLSAACFGSVSWSYGHSTAGGSQIPAVSAGKKRAPGAAQTPKMTDFQSLNLKAFGQCRRPRLEAAGLQGWSRLGRRKPTFARVLN